MIAHTILHVSDYKKSKAFYKKLLASLGYKNNKEYGEAAAFNDGKNTDFWVVGLKKGVIKSHIAFEAKIKKQVEDFYKAGLAAGGKDNGKPGYRKQYWKGFYAAYIIDPDGHNVEAVFYDYKAK